MRYGYLQANMMFVRQGIAVSIFFISLKYVEERKFWQYIPPLTSAASPLRHTPHMHWTARLSH